MHHSQSAGRSVVLIVRNHSIAGSASLGDRRLSDVLNDPRSSFVEINHALFSHLSDPGQVIDRAERTLVPKDKVILAFELSKEHATSPQRLYSYREKRKYPVFLATEQMQIRGLLHEAPAAELPDLSRLQEKWFIPLTKVRVTCCTIPNCTFQQNAILVNVHHLEYFSVGNAVDADR